jgi:hypothetical protein
MHAVPEPESAARIDRLSPEALVKPFAESRILGWFLVALAAHAVVIGALSLGTLRDLLDPEGAAARKAAAAAAAKAAPATETAAAPAATDTAAPATATAGGAAEAAGRTPAAEPARELSPVEKATTEAAKPDEIPRAPDDLGLSIEDTNPR